MSSVITQKATTSSADRELCRVMAIVSDASHRFGIDLDDICSQYYSIYGQTLDPKGSDCHTVYQLCQRLAKQSDHSIVFVDHKSVDLLFKNDRLFFDQKAYNKWIDGFKERYDFHFLESLAKHRIPPDVPLWSAVRLPPAVVPNTAVFSQQIQSFRAKIVHLESPDLMFIHLKTNNYSYSRLRHGLRFYDGTEDSEYDYVLPKELAIVKYYCAVKNPLDWDNWHRAVITHVDDDWVTVFAFDFGNIIVETRQELRLLKKEFFLYPIQAIKVSLTGIAPFDHNWSDEIIQFMKSFVAGFKADYNFGCIFIDLLGAEYYSVILHQMFTMRIENDNQVMPLYLHEKLIRKGLAKMVSYCFTRYGQYVGHNVGYKVGLNVGHDVGHDVSHRYEHFDTIEEPLMAIKCEADFDAYESAVVSDKQTDDDVKLDPKPQQSAGDQQSDPIPPASGHQSSPEFAPHSIGAQNVVQNDPKATEDKFDYKKLFFTSFETPEMKIKSYFNDFESFGFTQRKYFTEDSEFVCYERTNNTKTKASVAVVSKSKPKEYPTVPRKYMTPEDESYIERKYFVNDYFPSDYNNKYFHV